MEEGKIQQNHECEVCGKGFSSTKNLCTHRLSVHKISIRQQKLAKGSDYVCVVCNKKFASGNTLSRHRRQIHKYFKIKAKQNEPKVVLIPSGKKQIDWSWYKSKSNDETSLQVPESNSTSDVVHILVTQANLDHEEEIQSDAAIDEATLINLVEVQTNAQRRDNSEHENGDDRIHVEISHQTLGCTQRLEKAQRRHFIKCPACDSHVTFLRRSDFRKHLQEVHEVERIDHVVKQSFNSYQDFVNWKAEEERNERVRFLLHIRKKNKQYFFCNRSGKREYKGSFPRKRQEKAQGLGKIGHCCPATMVVNFAHEKVSVTYFPTHYGHTNGLAHIRLSTSLKEEIADQLRRGMKQEQILRDVRRKAGNSNTTLTRDHLVTRADIYNIRKSYNIPRAATAAQLHKSDVTSVRVMVSNERDKGQQNSILFYKEQGEPCAGLDDAELVIVIMSPYQKEMAKTFPRDRACVDSTHGASNYDFHLTTLLMADSFEEGIPVAFCISSRVNEAVLSVFLRTVKDAVGTISVNCLMSNDYPEFYDSWCSVMGFCDKHLLCAWHVVHAWQRKVTTIKREDVRKRVFASLKSCLYEQDKENLALSLNELCSQMENEAATRGFYAHFRKTYLNRVEAWAYAFRDQAKLNTDMHLENFHKQLKHICVISKRCKKLDKLLSRLFDFLQRSLLSRLRKIIFDQNVRRTEDIPKRHDDGIKLAHTCTKLDDDSWLIPSESNPTAVYRVRKLAHSCSPTTCGIVCSSCVSEICMNMFSCDCFDNTFRLNMCKHIHAVAQFEAMRRYETENEHLNSLDNIVVVNEEVELQVLSEPLPSADDVANELDGNLSALIDLIKNNSHSFEVLKGMNEHVEAALKLADANIEPVIDNVESTIEVPAHQNVQPAPGFDHVYCLELRF